MAHDGQPQCGRSPSRRCRTHTTFDNTHVLSYSLSQPERRLVVAEAAATISGLSRFYVKKSAADLSSMSERVRVATFDRAQCCAATSLGIQARRD